MLFSIHCMSSWVKWLIKLPVTNICKEYFKCFWTDPEECRSSCNAYSASTHLTVTNQYNNTLSLSVKNNEKLFLTRTASFLFLHCFFRPIRKSEISLFCSDAFIYPFLPRICPKKHDSAEEEANLAFT